MAAPVITLLATMASLFGYVTVNYFLAQVLAMPLVLCELMALHWLARQPRGRERIAGLVLLAAVVLTAILSYSPMAFFMQPVIIGAVCVSELGRGWLRARRGRCRLDCGRVPRRGCVGSRALHALGRVRPRVFSQGAGLATRLDDTP